MGQRAPDNCRRNYRNHSEFYAHAYGSSIERASDIGQRGAAIVRTTQTGGDWSDAPTPDLVIARLVSESVGTRVDLGHGRFSSMHRPGEFIVIGPQSGSNIQVAACHVCETLALPYAKYRVLFERDDLPRDGDFGRLHTSTLSDRRISQSLNQLFQLDDAQREDGLLTDTLILTVLDALSKLRTVRPREQRGGLSPTKLTMVKQLMEDELHQSLSLNDLARLAGMSPFHFCRAFKQSTGSPPHQWRQQVRMQKAKSLLSGTTDSVADIGLTLGYENPAHFATAFKKAVGMTPSSYRAAARH